MSWSSAAPVDRRTAKREAYTRAAGVLESALGEGWPDAEEYGYSDDDQTKVSAALREIVTELGRRGPYRGEVAEQ